VAIRLLNKIVERILSKTTYDGLTNTSPCKKANDDYVPYYQDSEGDCFKPVGFLFHCRTPRQTKLEFDSAKNPPFILREA
jgi:hypothetical protein